MKKFKLLFSLLYIFTLGACSAEQTGIWDGAKDTIKQVISIDGKELEKIVAYFRKEKVNITGFQFMEPSGTEYQEVDHEVLFDVGMFDELGLKLVATYSDNTTRELGLNYKRLPSEYVEIISHSGSYIFSLAYRNVTKSLELHVNYDPDQRMAVRYYDYDGNIIKSFSVTVGEVLPIDEIPEVPAREEDVRFIYADKRWTDNLLGAPINHNYDVYPTYNPVLKRYHGKTAYAGDGKSYPNRRLRKIYCNYDTHTWSLPYYFYFHMGRIYRTPLLVSNETINHIEGEANVVTYNFATNPYDISTVMDNILTNGFYFDTSAIGDTFDTGNEYTEPANIVNIGTDTETIAKKVNDNITTQFEEGGDIVTIYQTYLQDGLDAYLASNDQSFTATIPASSQTGYYKMTLEADIDIIFKIYVGEKSSSPKWNLYNVSAYYLINPNSIDITMDYSLDGVFDSTSLISYSAQDLYSDVRATE